SSLATPRTWNRESACCIRFTTPRCSIWQRRGSAKLGTLYVGFGMTCGISVATAGWRASRGHSATNCCWTNRSESVRLASESRDDDPLTAVHGRLVGTQPNHGPVARGLGVGQCRAFSTDGTQEGMHQVGMRSPMSSTLREREVLCPLFQAIHALGRKALDGAG